MIDKEIRRLGFSHAQLFREEWVLRLMRRYSFLGIDDLYASVGYGGLSAQKVVMSLRDNYKAEAKEQKQKDDLVNQTNTVQSSDKKKIANKGVIVKGIDNCLVRLSGCCNPVPGDEIVGFITRGRGVSVHRKDCPNMNPEVMTPADKARFIEVYWEDSGASDTYIANIQVEGIERDGLLLELSAMLSDMKINLKSVNANVTKNNIAIIQLGLEIKNTKDLELLMKRIKQIKDIISVKRTAN